MTDYANDLDWRLFIRSGHSGVEIYVSPNWVLSGEVLPGKCLVNYGYRLRALCVIGVKESPLLQGICMTLRYSGSTV